MQPILHTLALLQTICICGSFCRRDACSSCFRLLAPQTGFAVRHALYQGAAGVCLGLQRLCSLGADPISIDTLRSLSTTLCKSPAPQLAGPYGPGLLARLRSFKMPKLLFKSADLTNRIWCRAVTKTDELMLDLRYRLHSSGDHQIGQPRTSAPHSPCAARCT